jgi:hypothetical protein
MSFGSPPTPPDPSSTSAAQAGFNLAAAQQQNKFNSYNQSNPFGSQAYTADPNSPSGFSLNTSLSPNLQGLFNTNTGTASNLAGNSAGMYSQPFDLNAATGQTAKLLNNWQQQYLQPIFNQQQSNTDAQLHNQGLAPGSQAYNNAQNLLARNQGDITNQYLTQNEGQAFNQAQQNYMLPLQTEAGLLGAMPGNPQFAPTPTAQIQPPNYAGLAEQNYQQQNQAYGQQQSGLFGIANAGIKALPMIAGLF